MTPYWTKFAVALASFAQQKMPGTPRGVILVRCLGDGNTVAGAFGNDDYLTNEVARREVQLVRDRLRMDSIQELGFGLSLDGHSWAVVTRADGPCYQTMAGKLFQVELIKLSLQDVVERSWQKAAGLELAQGGRSVSIEQPAQ